MTHHSISVSVDVPGRAIEGTDRITLDKGRGEVRLVLRSGSELVRAEARGEELAFEVKEYTDDLNEFIVRLPPGEKRLTVGFRGRFQSPAEAAEHVKRGVAYLSDGVIGEEGVFLPSSAYWFPQEPDSLIVFEAEVTLPAGWSSVMEGELASSMEYNGEARETWREWKQVDGADLVAGRYFVEKEHHNGVAVYTFFFKKDEALSRTYLDKTKEHLDGFQSMIGPYPFKKFAVVENFMPTGYGMPSFTLLGTSVIRLPFIPATSLGHEIAHNWWGNSVFIDSSQGNWAEALTTYVSDYRSEENKGPQAAKEFRAAKLRGYKNYAGGSGIALRDFTDATEPRSRAVGYNKGLMVFNMLEMAIGEERFRAGLRMFYSENAFRRASWGDLQKSFEAASGEDLGWFFDQWLRRTDGPRLSLENVRASKRDGGYAVSFGLKQGSPAYSLYIPVLVMTGSGEVRKTVRFNAEAQWFTIELDSMPVYMELDPDLENFRELADEEVPPTLSGLLGDSGSVIVVPGGGEPREKYLPAAGLVAQDFKLEVMTDANAGVQDLLRDRSLFVFGGPGENRLYPLTAPHFSMHALITEGSFKVAGKSFPRKGTTLVMAVKNPGKASKTFALLTGTGGKEALMEAARRVRYFTDFSYLVFTEDGKVEKGLFDGERPLRHVFQ